MTLPSLDNPPIVIRESRWKAALVALGSVVFVATGVMMLGDPKASQGWAWLAILFFGGCGVIGAAQVYRPSTLTLDPSGFAVQQLFRRPWRVAWAQVHNFQVQQGSRSITRYIAFDYAPDLSMDGGLGRSGQLPPYWTMSPPDLCLLMKRCKDRWGSGPAQPPDPAFAADPPQSREPTVT